MLSPKMICGVHVRGDTVVQWLVALVALFLSFDSSSAWSYSLSSLEFLELGSSSANLTGSLPRGKGVNSDPIPISLPNGFPFSNETESTIFVNVNGFLSFRTARDYGVPGPFSSTSDCTHIVAPYWAVYDTSEQGEVAYEVHTTGDLLDQVNWAMSQELNVTFEGVWLLVVYWNNIYSPLNNQLSRFQAVLVTDGTKSYCLFIYHCGFLRFSSAVIGFSASGNFSFNHRVSRWGDSKEVACRNRPDSDWNTLVYALHYDGVRPYIVTNPEGPVFQAGKYITYYFSVMTPGSFFYRLTLVCQSTGSVQEYPISSISGQSITIISTPIQCIDVFECTAWDDAGSTGQDRALIEVTGVGLGDFNNRELRNNTSVEADSAYQLDTVVYCHSASNQPNIGRWISPSGEEISPVGNHMFRVQFHSATYHSYTSLSLRDGVQFSRGTEGVYSCIIPDENGVEQILHFGVYDYDFTSGGIPAVVSLHPLSMRVISEDPFIISCDSTHLPPYLVQWWQDGDVLGEELSSSHLIHRRNSTYENTLYLATGHGTTFKCIVSVGFELHYPPFFKVVTYEHIAVIQPFGGRWDVTCSLERTQPTTALTWETEDRLQLSRSSNNMVHYSAPAEVSQELVCYGWSGEKDKTPLQFVSLIIPGTIVGFTSTTYTGSETSGDFAVCVEVLNPPSGGATQPFNVTLLPAEEHSNQHQQWVECSTVFEFERGTSVKCVDCSIVQDDACYNSTSFELILGLPSTDTLGVHPSRSRTRITVDDSSEPECYVRVGYEHTSYTISELRANKEICITSRSPGIDERFTINIATNSTTNSLGLFQQTSNSLHFVVSYQFNPSLKACYMTTFDFDADDICERFKCSAIELESTLTKVNETARVYLSRPTAVLVIELPERCRCAPTQSNDSRVTTLQATISSLAVVICIVAAVVFIMLCYRKRRKTHLDQSVSRDNQCAALEESVPNMYFNIPLQTSRTTRQVESEVVNAEESRSTDETDSERYFLSPRLQEQLKKKRMIFSKNHIELSTIIGQGKSGLLVHRAYLKTPRGKELVAVKTVKALFSRKDVERLAKEVFTMFSLKHTNVMSLRGVCVAAECPLLIMPFMTNGSVLEFVQHHKDELLCISTEAKVEIARERLLKICHQISKGMEYLALRNFVHRDLGASNCMIDNDGVIKVADFGLAKNMHGTDYFRQGKGEGEDEEVPIKWMAPESLEDDIYTEATDVWSFGVTVWEVFTCGRIPYIDIPVVHLLEVLKGGQRLEKPQNEACPDEIYDTMKSCWSLRPGDRPTFLDLVGMLTTLLERSSDMCPTSYKLDMSQFLHSNVPLSCPPTAPIPPVIQEQDAEDEDEDQF